MRFTGKVVIVTGSDSGIGRATAEALAREGADVAVTFHTDEAGAQETGRAVEAAGRRAFVTRTDVGDAASVEALFCGSRAALGEPDFLVANAGTGMSRMPVAEMDETKLELVLRTDLVGPLLCARAFVRARKRLGGGGRLLFIGSVAGHLPTPGSAPYGMAELAGALTLGGGGARPHQRERHCSWPDRHAHDAGAA